jgi:hypothetical protein
MDISKYDYVAKPTEIAELTHAIIASETVVFEGRATYLRALVGTTQAELPADGKADKAATLGALEAVHTRFYEAVTKAVQADTPPRVADRAKLVNRRTNFARTALYAVKAWVRAGNDLAKLKAKNVTKGALAVPRKPRAVTAGRLVKRVEKLSTRLMAEMLALMETDKPTAIREIETLAGSLAHQLEELGVHATRMRGGKMYVPLSASQVLRQEARPS